MRRAAAYTCLSMDEDARPARSTREGSLDIYRDRLTRVLSYVQDNLGGEISLDAAASVACFSKYHFHRIFSGALGEAFADHVRRLRLERAANLLELHPAMSVTEVAIESGFSSASILSRLFSERFGTAPTRWRQERLAVARAMSRGPGPAPALPTSSELWGQNLAANGSDDSPPPPVSIRRLPALRLASCLHVGAYGPGIGEAWGRLFRWSGPRGLLSGPFRSIGLSWDNPDICPTESCRYSACVEIPPDIEVSGDVVILAFPPRTYLCLRFEGAEADFAEAYERLYRRLLPESGFEPEDSPALEMYRSFPGDAARFDLDIALPVRPLS